MAEIIMGFATHIDASRNTNTFVVKQHMKCTDEGKKNNNVIMIQSECCVKINSGQADVLPA